MKVIQLGGIGFDANIFLVLAGKCILVDAGTGTYATQVIGQVRKNLAGGNLDRLVLTHRHFDHTGGAAGLVRQLGVKAYISEPDLGPVADGDGMSTGAWMFGARMQKVDCAILSETESVDLGDARLQVISTPGHSIGSICLFEPDSKSLFSGDTVFSGGGVGRWDLPSGDFSQLKRSVRKLASMDVENLYPGHGEVVEGDANASIKWSLEGLS